MLNHKIFYPPVDLKMNKKYLFVDYFIQIFLNEIGDHILDTFKTQSIQMLHIILTNFNIHNFILAHLHKLLKCLNVCYE